MAGGFILLMLIGSIFSNTPANYEHYIQMLVVVPIVVTIGVFVVCIRRDTTLETDALRRVESITCECGKLAEPIGGTPNRYKCQHCGRQFAGPFHSL